MKTAVFLFVTRFGDFFFIKPIAGLTYQSIYQSVRVQEKRFISILVVLLVACFSFADLLIEWGCFLRERLWTLENLFVWGSKILECDKNT